MSKHILCALVDRQPEVLEAICRVGRKNHWLIEHADRTIYRNWHGDGVISDYLSLKELKRIRNFSTTPIVSRQLAVRSPSTSPPAESVKIKSRIFFLPASLN